MRLYIILLVLIPCFLSSQNVGIGTEIPDASAALEIQSSSKGLLIPRTDTSLIISPAEGLLIYQLSDQRIYQFRDISWHHLNAPNNIIIDGDKDTYVTINEINDMDEVRFYVKNNLHMQLDKNHLGLQHGFSNLSIGRNAGIADNLLDNRNTNLGYNSGVNNVSGLRNVHVGALTSTVCDSCSNNTFIGYSAGEGSFGSSNTYLGRAAGRYSEAGIQNTYIGKGAGQTSQGSGNVFLGHDAGRTDITGNNRLYIANSQTTSPLIYGEFDNGLLRVNDKFEVVNDEANSDAVNIVKAGYGSGIISRVKEEESIPDLPIDPNRIPGIYSSSQSTSSGINTLGIMGEAVSSQSNATGAYFVADGSHGSTGVAGIAHQGLPAANSYGGYFIASGENGIGSLSIGAKFGVLSSGDLGVTSTFEDTAFIKMASGRGFDSLYNSIARTREHVLLVGDLEPNDGEVQFQTDGITRVWVKGSGHTGIGTSTPSQTLHVKGSMKIEAESSDAELRMQSINGAENRIIVVQDSNEDIIMGDIDGDNRDLELWTNGVNRLRIKEDGQVGIGVFDPGSRFHVREDGIAGAATTVQILESRISKRPRMVFAENDYNVDPNLAGMSIEYDGAGTGGNNRMLINKIDGSPIISFRNDGNVGIGTTIASEALEVVGNIIATGTISSSSDIRYKSNLFPINNALSKVTQLNGYYYNWKANEFPDRAFTTDRQIGVIAQEVEALFPEMVITDKKGHKSVDYSRLTPVLIEAVKELQSQLSHEKARIDQLERLIKEVVKTD